MLDAVHIAIIIGILLLSIAIIAAIIALIIWFARRPMRRQDHDAHHARE